MRYSPQWFGSASAEHSWLVISGGCLFGVDLNRNKEEIHNFVWGGLLQQGAPQMDHSPSGAAEFAGSSNWCLDTIQARVSRKHKGCSQGSYGGCCRIAA